MTGLSGYQVEQEDVKGKLVFNRLPARTGSSNSSTVATTRRETMFGDTAVAVHPEDPRYNRLTANEFVSLLHIAGFQS